MRERQALSEMSIQYIKGVGPARKKLFANLGVETVEDLLYLFPRRYEDRTQMIPIAQVKLGEMQTVSGKVMIAAGRQTWFSKKKVYEMVVDDGTGRLFCVWFNQPYLQYYFKEGIGVVLYGKIEIYKNRLQMVSPEYEIIEANEPGENLNAGRIVPIYPLTRGMTQRYVRKITRACLERFKDEIRDILPVSLRNKLKLANLHRSIENLHFPETLTEQEDAFRRVSFEEFFLFQISVILRRMSIVQKKGIAHRITGEFVEKFSNAFPFKLTAAQTRVIGEISRDMMKDPPMLRLLQGDVGSGKTVVALFGCAAAHENGHQSAIMAPTEILARQHFEKISEMVMGFKEELFRPRVCLLTSSVPPKERDKILRDIKEGSVDIVIGTHALLSEAVAFKNLSFVVIDEQHKFGVKQRALLSTKGTNPDVLIMTATPIPRTLCMTLYGDLDTSVLDEMPPGRGKITTKLFPQANSEEVYKSIKEMVKTGKQVYIVYPLIEESDALELKAAEKMFADFQKNAFGECRVGLAHGQLKKKDAAAVMADFKNKKLDILVATTVVEVGVDVPNASVMVIEHAERFGLSQLHQLRGRIGRGKEDALCILISDPETEGSQARLEAILKTTDGFKIAEYDFKIRGPGQYFGRHQHGLNELRVADPIAQVDILELARKEALELVHMDPQLAQPEHMVIKETIRKRYPEYLKMVEAG